jgi:hypothetical protein
MNASNATVSLSVHVFAPLTVNTTQHTKNKIAAPTPVIPCVTNARSSSSIRQSRAPRNPRARIHFISLYFHITSHDSRRARARIARRTLDTHARNDPTAYVTYVSARARAIAPRRPARETPATSSADPDATPRWVG